MYQSAKILFFICVFALGIGVSPSRAEAPKVENGKKIKFNYTLKVEGQVVESTEGKEPLEYTHGEGQLIPGLASQLEGMHVGDQKTVVVKPEDAYGQVNPEAIQELPKTSFPADFKPKEGMVVELKGPEGDVLPAVIMEIKDQTIVLNFNHPLAGKTLEFDVKIVSIEG